MMRNSIVALVTIGSVVLMNYSVALGQQQTTPQQPTATPVNPDCGRTYAWPPTSDGYQKAIIEAATFKQRSHHIFRHKNDRTRFLISFSSTDTVWIPNDFYILNRPGEYWAPVPQRFTASPRFEQFQEPFDKTKNPIMALGVVPIYEENGVQYCLTPQVTRTYLQPGHTLTTIEDFGTTSSSPIFATIEVQFSK